MVYELSAIEAVWLVLYGLFFFLSIALAMALHKGFQNTRDTVYRYELKHSIDAIHLYIEEPNPTLLPQIKRNPLIRDYIVDFTDRIVGQEREHIKMLYHELRYYQRDLKDLRHPYYKKRLFALLRLSRLREKISRKSMERMIDDSFPIIRWQAMEYLIHAEGRKSLSTLLYFIHRYFSKSFIGVIYHLVGLYASLDREGVAFLVRHTENEDLVLALMKVMEEYPHHSANDAIWDIVKVKSHQEVIVSALKILGANPDERYFSLLDMMHDHEFWVIRMYVAKRLVNYQTSTAFAILEKLSHDDVYLVRVSACQSLIGLNTHESNQYLATLLKSESHPSFQIMKNQFNIISFYG